MAQHGREAICLIGLGVLWSLVKVVGSYPIANVGGVEFYFTAEGKLNCDKTSKSQLRATEKPWGELSEHEDGDEYPPS